jgi:1-acyl-sn-glycerol-3-phosphate acyltransferase
MTNSFQDSNVAKPNQNFSTEAPATPAEEKSGPGSLGANPKSVISTGAERSGETRFSTSNVNVPLVGSAPPAQDKEQPAATQKSVISTEAERSGETRFSTSNVNVPLIGSAAPAQDKEQPAATQKAVISTGAERSGETRFSTSNVNDPTPPPSKKPPFALRWLSYLLLVPLIGIATGLFGCISLLCGLWDRSGRQQHAIAHLWARTLLLISLSPVRLIGGEKLHQHGTAVYASNHLSYMDTPVLFARLPFQFRILAKQALWKVPFIGWYLNRSGQVPVDTKSSRSLIASLNRGVNTLKQGTPLVLFPEGGRAATGHLQAMMSGCAYMAIKAQVPLIPLTLVGTYELLPIHVYALHPRPLYLIVGDPIPTTGLNPRDADALTQRLYESISNTYSKNRA